MSPEIWVLTPRRTQNGCIQLSVNVWNVIKKISIFSTTTHSKDTNYMKRHSFLMWLNREHTMLY